MIKIRAAAAVEADVCEEVLRAAFADYVHRLGRQQSADAYAWLGDAIADRRVVVAVDGATIVGVGIVSTEGDMRTIEQIAVRPGKQGRGIGGKLIEDIEARAGADGIHLLALDTAAMMTDLLRLYARHGFEIVRRGQPRHGRDEHTRAFMYKTIQSP